METDDSPVALITGGSAGLGFVIAETLIRRGYRVMIVGRDPHRLQQACERLQSGGGDVFGVTCDLTDRDQVSDLIAQLGHRFGRLDALVNCVGTSDRGLVENLTPQRLEELVQQNVVTALHCSQAALPLLEESGGVIVNIGSLAAKVGARFIGGYAAAKHALAGMSQQMRLELKPRGVHVALVNPGPIRRQDAGLRYERQIDGSLPPQAAAPGAGTRIKGLSPQRVADAVVRCIERRQADVILPGHLRLLIAIGHAFPRLGDWLLLKFTSSGD